MFVYMPLICDLDLDLVYTSGGAEVNSFMSAVNYK